MSTDLTKVNKADLKAYEAEAIAEASKTFPSKYNIIKVWYDSEKPDMVGHFAQIKEGETEWKPMGDSFKGVILAQRHQYSMWSEDENERMYTSLFKDWGDEVTIFTKDNEETVKGVSHWKKAHYPEATYICWLYVLVDGLVNVIKVRGASCEPLFTYQKGLPKGKATFSYETEFGHTQAKKGATIYYPLSFTKGKDLEGEEYSNALKMSFETSSALDAKEEKTLTEDQQDKMAAEALEILS